MGQTYLLVLESLPDRWWGEGKRAAVAHPGDVDTAGSHIWELILLCRSLKPVLELPLAH